MSTIITCSTTLSDLAGMFVVRHASETIYGVLRMIQEKLIESKIPFECGSAFMRAKSDAASQAEEREVTSTSLTLAFLAMSDFPHIKSISTLVSGL